MNNLDKEFWTKFDKAEDERYGKKIQREFLKVYRFLLKEYPPGIANYLSELIDYRDYLLHKGLIKPHDFFFFYREKIEELTGISSQVQKDYTERLVNDGVLLVERNGEDRKNYYLIVPQKLYEIEKRYQSVNLTPLGVNHTPTSVNLTLLSKTNLINEELRSSFPNPSDSEIEEQSISNASHLSDSEPSTPLLKRRIPLESLYKPFKPSKDIYDIVQYWNSSNGVPHLRIDPQSPSNAYKEVCSMLRNALDGKFFTSLGLTDQEQILTKKDITRSIDRFKLFAVDRNYLPADKDGVNKLGLRQFLHNPMGNQKSYFVYFLNNEPRLLRNSAKPLEDPNPTYSQWLRKSYERHVLMGQQPKWDQLALNKFIEAGKKLQKAFYKLAPMLITNIDQVYASEVVIKALISKFSVKGVTPGHVASDWTYNVLLPQQLADLGFVDRKMQHGLSLAPKKQS